METIIQDPPSPNPETSEQPYLENQERQHQSGEMTGEVANLMRQLKDHFNGSNEELAKALGVRATTVNRWFNGETKPNGNSMMRAKRLAQTRGLIEDEKSH